MAADKCRPGFQSADPPQADLRRGCLESHPHHRRGICRRRRGKLHIHLGEEYVPAHQLFRQARGGYLQQANHGKWRRYASGGRPLPAGQPCGNEGCQEKNPVTDYLFQRISTNLRDGIGSSVDLDGDSFYQAFYYARQAGGFVQGQVKANIAMHPRVTDGLRLRARPDSGSRALGTFFGNVEVLVVQDDVKDREGGLWCQVQLGNLAGYMKRTYLSFLPGDHGYAYARESLLRETVSNVSLFDSATCAKEVAKLDAGTVLQLLGMEGNCYYVRTGEQYGFVKQTILWLEK